MKQKSVWSTVTQKRQGRALFCFVSHPHLLFFSLWSTHIMALMGGKPIQAQAMVFPGFNNLTWMLLEFFFACSSDVGSSTLCEKEGNFIHHLDLSSNPAFHLDLWWTRVTACLRKQLQFGPSIFTHLAANYTTEHLILCFLFLSPHFYFICVSLCLVVEMVLSFIQQTTSLLHAK